jgi:ATP-binding cassette subfamily B protein
MRPYWLFAIGGPIFMTLEVAMDLLQPWFVARLIDDGVAKGDLDAVVRIGILMLGAAVIGLLGGAISGISAVRATMYFSADLREALFRKVQAMSFGNLDRLETGQLITRLTNDVTQVQEMSQMVLRIMVRIPLLLVGSVIMATITAPKLALIFLYVIPMIIIAIVFVFQKSYPKFEIVQKSLDRLNTVMQENLAGIRVVRAFSRNDFERDRFHGVNTELMENNIRAVRTTNIMFPAMILSSSAGMISSIWFGGNQVASGDLAIGDLIAFNTYALQAMFALMFFSQLVVRVTRGEASSVRIREVLDTVPDLADPAKPQAIASPKGELVFDHVTMSYVDGEAPVLNDISFRIEPGKTLAILGATGSGKSTLVNLIPRFYDIESGGIRIDGIDVRTLPQHRLREIVGIALQETVLFSGSIRDNIRYGRPTASDEEVIAAAKAAQAHPFIETLPQGYDSIVGQRGVNLSGGQKQRIAIARALLMQPTILILDDSTSAVDVATESRIQHELESVPHTRVIVAQRISSVLKADTILVLERGRIVAEGSHDDLLRTSDTYRDIYESQQTEGQAVHGD